MRARCDGFVPATVTCPANHYQGTTATNSTCRTYPYPLLENNIFWQISAYYIGVGALSAQYQQNVVSLRRWGPLSLLNPVTNTPPANYRLTAGSPILDLITREGCWWNSTELSPSRLGRAALTRRGTYREIGKQRDYLDLGQAIRRSSTSTILNSRKRHA